MSREKREIQDPLVTGRVVGDVVDLFTRSTVLRIVYNNRPVANGAAFKPSAVCSRPRVHVGDSDFRTLFTLVLVDPDSPNPSNPTKREHLHWLVTNIPGSTDASFGQEIITYESPEPSVGIHRLVFVLFRQSSRQTTAAAPERRENFSTRAFAAQNQLGQPAAVVYYNCQRESGCGGRRFT
ncbi:hypothetical protein Taro_049208 [Colocasia esculenta]|uniref:Uncharacterized protein n=1 Tax=Colocasia esculenta TaxID=4460 RepID=A0A843XAB6_COLES|nr:hypothetical protein [Colocasia esculenta]